MDGETIVRVQSINKILIRKYIPIILFVFRLGLSLNTIKAVS